MEHPPHWALVLARVSREVQDGAEDQARRLCYSQGATCTFNCSPLPNYSTWEVSGEADTRVLVRYCSISPASHQHIPLVCGFCLGNQHTTLAAGKSLAAPRSASKRHHTATVQRWSFHLQGSDFIRAEEPRGVLPRRASLRSLTHRGQR